MTNDKNNLKNQKRGGFYWKDDKPYVSVTEVLKMIDKPQLRYWFGEQIYYAMVANPTLEKQKAMQAPYATSDKAKDRGSTVHSIVEAFEHGNKIEDQNIPDQFKGYAKAFYNWVETSGAKVEAHERTVFSELYQYAGTLDLLVKLNNDPYPIVVDVKTGKDIYEEAFMQVSAYRQALTENSEITSGVGILLLKEDGDYKFQMSDTTARKFLGFIACRDIWIALNEEMLKKIGYLKEEK